MALVAKRGDARTASWDAEMQGPSNIDLTREVAGIRRAAAKATAFCAVCLAAGYWLLPRVLTFPREPVDALLFTLRVDLFIVLWVVIAIGLVSHARRQSPADIRGSAFGVASPEIRIKIAFLQNTLEQAFVAIGAHLVFSTLMTGRALALVVVAAALFAVGRVTFYRGYPHGAAARAFGIVTTVIPTLLILVLALWSMGRAMFAP